MKIRARRGQKNHGVNRERSFHAREKNKHRKIKIAVNLRIKRTISEAMKFLMSGESADWNTAIYRATGGKGLQNVIDAQTRATGHEIADKWVNR